jgi:hypothetical protein
MAEECSFNGKLKVEVSDFGEDRNVCICRYGYTGESCSVSEGLYISLNEAALNIL